MSNTFKYKAIEEFYVTQIILKAENTVLPENMLVLQNRHVPPATLCATCTACKPKKIIIVQNFQIKSARTTCDVMRH